MTTSNTEPPPKPGPAHKRLEAFAGRWSKEGQAFDSPFGPAATITGVETYKWLPGGFFLVHRLVGQLDDEPIACIEVIGHDASSDSYSVHTFYNNGTRKEWQLQERGGTWLLTGDWAVGGASFKVRCTTVFEDGGKAMTARWEYAQDGSTWQVFWDTSLTRAE